MASGDKAVTYAIKVDAKSNAADAANSVEALRAKVTSGTDAIKQHQAALRNLRGSTDAVKAAKDKLKASIAAERDKVSQATLALTGMGAALKDAKAATDEASAGAAGLRGAIAGVGGAAGIAVVAYLGLVGAVGGLAVSLVKAGIEAGNLRRSQQLLNEAASGSAENARAMATQIDAVARVTPKSRAELTDLYLSMVRLANGTRMSGDATTDAFKAVATASSAMGDKAGAAIQDIITRGKMMGRMGLGFQELEQAGLGGLGFGDVAKELSKDLGISLQAAQMQLAMGRVKLDAGAKAIREAVDKRFGGIAKRQMLDLNVQATRFKDNLATLTEAVDLTPVLSSIKSLADLFDQSTVSGQTLKSIVTTIGKVLGKAFEGAKPIIEAVFGTMINMGLRATIVVLQAALFIKQNFGGALGTFDAVTAAVWTTRAAFILLATPIVAAAASVALFVGFAVAIAKSVEAIPVLFEKLKAAFAAIDWPAVGRNILLGLTAGLSDGIPDLVKRVGEAAGKVKEGFKNALGIHSPSAVFAEYGRQTTAGYEQGISEGGGPSGVASRALAAPAPPATGSAPASPGASVSIGAVTVNVAFPNAKSGPEVTQALTSESFKAQLVRALEEVAKGVGAPSGAPA